MDSNTHKIYMDRCLELASIAAAQGESAVGSVIVHNGEIIGEGYEKSRQFKDVTRHAEVVAILDAVQKHGTCEGATLYSNAEPCILCSYVIRHNKIASVVFSRYCGELGGTSEKFNILTTNGISSWAPAPAVHFYTE
ncbi:nucleoside deaminase [Mucilaginibacter aquaedulcis]|uniref:nucleoside deaminase n=1 Tax=Mucilaginibacter aquaedulcis TaxID=1187081 RepID=UPI0025B36336|nr:nucleoside deaminase [Mucilaginibacter aquaedulcis]MDN3551502.1 nucleoside deaminase [Mucilaginibacter aquaedulcis]